MPTRHTIFTPLTRVPSAFLNGLQDGILPSRANQAINTLATGLDTPDSGHIAKRLIFALDVGLHPGADLDTSIDWRDRVLVVRIWADPIKDIRPGEANDDTINYAKWQITREIYTRSGNDVITFGTSFFALQVHTTGKLQLIKGTGYVVGIIEASPQIKERS